MTLKSHANKSRLVELQSNTSLRSHSLFELSLDESKQFGDYVFSVTEKQLHKVWLKHFEILQHLDTIKKFPEHPKDMYLISLLAHFRQSKCRSYHWVSNSLKVTFKTNRLHMQIQFGNLVNQTHDLAPTSPTEFQHFKSTVLDCCHG